MRAPLLLALVLAGVGAHGRLAEARPREVATPAELARLQAYIRRGWTVLRRTHKELLAAAIDEKIEGKRATWPVYVSAREDVARVREELRREMSADDAPRIEIKVLPERGPPSSPGLLYLPRPYVVPGGRFNEMYGWDSYFIQVGLLRDGELQAARDLVDNFVYEVEHYGHILNANRSYYLSRSQPPFLTQMVLGVYRKTGDRAWLAATVPAIEKYHRYWVSPPHLTPETGLSRYHDLGRGPAIEVLSGEKDADGRTHYDRVRAWFAAHDVADYDEARFYDAGRDRLTDLFYLADRSMRESGFDPSNRFGPFNAGVLDHDPVCLNSLLYAMEQQLAEILAILGRPPAEVARWKERAEARARAVNTLLWDEQQGLYLDYDFTAKRRRDYPFGTTFFPLWVGLASPQQAARLAAQLPRLERAGGLVTSTTVSGNQWDAPFGWAPLQQIAVEGLRRYGHHADADRITANFLSLVLKEFLGHGAIFEKYDVEARRSTVAAGLKFGYTSNEIGFGWTNAAFVELYAQLPDKQRASVRQLRGVPLPARR